jgi:Rrf2 family protein
VVVLGEMAQCQSGGLQTAISLSSKTGLPEPTVAKVLKLLTKGGLISSSRGVNGGYQLSKQPELISMGSVIFALEGPVLLTSCVDGHEACCTHSASCSMKGKWNPVNEAMKTALEGVTLAQMITSQTGQA